MEEKKLNSRRNYILREIMLAQVASNAGKGIPTDPGFYGLGAHNTARIGYARKVEHQLNAIRALRHTPRCGINWFVVKTPDQNGYPSILVYFDISAEVIGNKRKSQISFHNPTTTCGDELRELVWPRKVEGKLVKQLGRKTRWIGGAGGSMETAIAIAEYLKSQGALAEP